MRISKVVLLFAVAVALLSGCDSREVKLTVVNQSAASLTNVIAAGPGFSAWLGSVAPASRTTVAVPRPRTDAGFTLTFEANGKRHAQATGSDPWDGFKEIIMTVSPQFDIGIESVTTF